MIKAVSEKLSGILKVKTYVLDDGRVVVTATQLQEAFGHQQRGTVGDPQVAKVPRFLATKSLKPFIGADLAMRLNVPVEFMLLQGGATALGYDSDIVTDVALAVVEAGFEAALRRDQGPMLAAARGYLKATSRVGGRLALLDEHGLQPPSGAAADLQAELAQLRGEVQRAQLDAKEKGEALDRQVKEGAALSLRLAEQDQRLRVLASGALREVPAVLGWLRRAMEDVAALRRYGQPQTTEAQALGSVQEELRRVLHFQHLPWAEFPYGRMDELRSFLYWLHRDARKTAKRHGFQGGGAFTQPPLPFVGLDDPGDDADDE